jgi:hypothetical protein
VYVQPRAEVLFGDIFEAAGFFDVHLRGDSARLTSAQFPPKAPLSGTFYVEPTEAVPLRDDVVLAHGRSGREREGREHVDTMRLPGRAVLLSDDCHIPTAYGRRPDRSEARGRLMFAPVVSVDEEELARVGASKTFSRFALPAEGQLSEGAVAELRRTFLVAAADVDPGTRIASLDEAGREALEKRWNAFVCRRGPEASWENALKLGRLVAGQPDLPQATEQAVQALWRVLDLAWSFEGSTMRAASAAFEAGGPSGPVLEDVKDDLRGLAALVEHALSLLDGLP